MPGGRAKRAVKLEIAEQSGLGVGGRREPGQGEAGERVWPRAESFPLPTEDAAGGGCGERVRDECQHRSAGASVLPADGQGPAGPRGVQAAAPEGPPGYGTLPGEPHKPQAQHALSWGHNAMSGFPNFIWGNFISF